MIKKIHLIHSLASAALVILVLVPGSGWASSVTSHNYGTVNISGAVVNYRINTPAANPGNLAAPAATPDISSFTPSKFCAGSSATVTITGTDFTGATAVKFNGVTAASFIVDDNTQITAIAPANATTGTITVTTPEGTATSITDYTILAAPAANAGPALAFAVAGISYTFPTATASNGTIEWTWEILSGALTASTFTGTSTVHPDFKPSSTGSAKFIITVTSSIGCGLAKDSITLLISSTDPTTWSGASSNDWHFTANWFPPVIPDATTNVVIPSPSPRYPTISAAASCNNIKIESGASLLGNDNLAVYGTAIVEQAITGGNWHLISSPFTDALSGIFTGKYLQKHTESTNAYTYISATTEPLTPTKGYAIYSASGFTAQYSGMLTDGPESFTTSNVNLGWNLVGNPYPSAIDWSAASGWTKSGINDATYVLAGAGWKTYIADASTNGGSRYIPATQGFFVKASANGTLGMNNSVRVHSTVSFFKNTSESVPNLVRLEVSGNGYTDEAVVRFLPEATAGFDGSYDADKLYGDVTEAAQIYTLGTIPLSINALPETDMVPVGIHAGASGTYTIAATEINDLKFVTLEDTKTGIFTGLTDNPYTFTLTAGESEDRFKLHFSTLSVDETESVPATIYSNQKTVYITMKDQVKGEIFIYNITGQMVASKSSTQGIIQIGLPVTGNYIVKVITKDNTVVRKVFIE